ncbi:MAG: hypothetical protein HYX68_10895 [Planctomycetes bacterium]|jgi:uncharacterized protein (TIGR03067 family)|nr:hypothetical protein [Planctomycetota bacterium]
MHFSLVAAVLVFAVPDRPSPFPDDTRVFQERILGEWQVVSHFTGGRDDNRNNLMWVFTSETMQHVYLRNGKKDPGGKFPYTLDSTRNPAVIRFPASKFAGIMKLEGDSLTVCLHGSPALEPPVGFVSPPNTSITLLRLVRVRKY